MPISNAEPPTTLSRNRPGLLLSTGGIIDVTIASVQRSAVASSTNNILVTEQYQLTITAKATYVNRRLGRKIFENTGVTGSTYFFTQADIQEGIRQALPLAAQDLANNTVKLVTEGW